MKLDAKLLRYLSNDDFRVLTATEMGSRNHEVVPTQLIISLSSLKHSPKNSISTLAKHGLIARLKNNSYDGYRLTYGGFDYLALKSLSRKILSVGSQIGIGKESDIYVVDDGEIQRILKIHRLGRISFRNVKEKRDYLRGRRSSNWLYLARLSAEKEFQFMKLLFDNGFPVPIPIDQNRHMILMSYVAGVDLHTLTDHEQPELLFNSLMSLILKLALFGLIHCDFNEFNLMIDGNNVVLIDFPQMVSINHPNARELFDRDVDCIVTFFEKRFRFIGTGVSWSDVVVGKTRLDKDASGHSGVFDDCDDDDTLDEETLDFELEKMEIHDQELNVEEDLTIQIEFVEDDPEEKRLQEETLEKPRQDTLKVKDSKPKKIKVLSEADIRKRVMSSIKKKPSVSSSRNASKSGRIDRELAKPDDFF